MSDLQDEVANWFNKNTIRLSQENEKAREMLLHFVSKYAEVEDTENYIHASIWANDDYYAAFLNIPPEGFRALKARAHAKHEIFLNIVNQMLAPKD